MADITGNAANLAAGGWQTVTPITLTASDTLTFRNSPQQRLVLVNTTGSSNTVTLDGDGAAIIPVDGFGPVDPTNGLALTIANNAVRALSLNTRGEYLKGTITITGGTGVTAYLLEN